jgi:hypothetical protein
LPDKVAAALHPCVSRCCSCRPEDLVSTRAIPRDAGLAARRPSGAMGGRCRGIRLRRPVSYDRGFPALHRVDIRSSARKADVSSFHRAEPNSHHNPSVKSYQEGERAIPYRSRTARVRQDHERYGGQRREANQDKKAYADGCLTRELTWRFMMPLSIATRMIG